jgi:hypothetical protein
VGGKPSPNYRAPRHPLPQRLPLDSVIGQLRLSSLQRVTLSGMLQANYLPLFDPCLCRAPDLSPRAHGPL